MISSSVEDLKYEVEFEFEILFAFSACSRMAGRVAPIQQKYVHSASSENIPDPRSMRLSIVANLNGRVSTYNELAMIGLVQSREVIFEEWNSYR